MLAGLAPVFNQQGTFLPPALAAGNDSYTVSLLHCDAPDANIGTTYIIESGYAAPSSRVWTIASGSGPATVASNFNQVLGFNGGAIQCPHGADLNPVGDFTIDFWAAFAGSQTAGFIAKAGGGGYSPYAFNVNGTNLTFYMSSNGTSWDLVNGAILANGFVPGTWYHFAVTRQGSTVRTFLNGALGQTITGVGAPLYQSPGPLTIGGTAGFYMNGWLEEFRFSNGISRWVAAFTPPNQPYYARINQGGNDGATKLLLHLDGNLNDVAKGSVNPSRHAFTNYGCGFQGSGTALMATCLTVTADGQRITCPQSAEFNFGAANFTIDFWYYRWSNGGIGDVISKRATNGEMAPFLIYDGGSGTVSMLMSVNGSAWDVNLPFTTTFPLATWQHLAAVRNGSDLGLYVNGARTATQNIGSGGFWRNNNLLSIGGNTTNSTRSTIDEVRISDVARWTGPFSLSQPYS